MTNSDPQKLSSASHSNDELELELSRIPNMHPLSVPYVMRFISTYYSRKVTKIRCKRGHKLEEPNIYIKPSTGTRECVECRRIRRKRVEK